MRRILWFDPDTEGPSSQVDWRVASLILATLFLNFAFAEFSGGRFWLFSSLPVHMLLVGSIALLVTALFFMGPALATQSAGRPLFSAMEHSLGSVPAFGVRVCCVVFLSLWIAAVFAQPVWWYETLSRETSAGVSSSVAVVLLAFLFITAQQSLQTEAKLALFTNKLGIAILIAALIRVRDGWPAVLNSIATSWPGPAGSQMWFGFSEMVRYIAPLALLGASFGYRSRGRRQVAMIGLMGVAVPIFVTLFLVGVIGVALFASRLYTPSVTPTVGMALSSHVARSALAGRMMVVAVTLFGAVRFCARSLAEAAAIRTNTRWGWMMLGCFVVAIAWTSQHPFVRLFTSAIDWSGRCLGIAGAVITVDFLVGKRRTDKVRRVDWIGSIAILAGLATPLLVPFDPWELRSNSWWNPLLLPSYFVAFMVCLCGRLLQKLPTFFQTSP